jgi:hypothetical protein
MFVTDNAGNTDDLEIFAEKNRLLVRHAGWFKKF